MVRVVLDGEEADSIDLHLGSGLYLGGIVGTPHDSVYVASSTELGEYEGEQGAGGIDGVILSFHAIRWHAGCRVHGGHGRRIRLWGGAGGR